ncbi:MAG: hypothetical protein AAB731_05400 [Patescibacteria group bacterium]
MKNHKRLSGFTKKETRWDLYPRFLNLIKGGFEVEAFLLILSTWNFARFRYVVRSFDLGKFIIILKKIEPLFAKFYNLNFGTTHIQFTSATAVDKKM